MPKRALAPLAWAAWIFLSSCTVVTRSQWLGTVQSTAPRLATRQQLDSFWERYWWVFVKGYHVLEYTVLFMLLAWALPKMHRLIIWALCILYAATDEIHQLWVPARGGHVSDVLIDAGGATLGLTLWWAIIRRRLPPP